MPHFSLLIYILIFTFIGSVGSLVGGLFLLWKRSLSQKISHLLISFAAGVLLGAAFLDLIPGAAGLASLTSVLQFTLVGFFVFFIFERFIRSVHRHAEHDKKERRTLELIIVGGAFHKLIDGAAIAATFLVNVPLGIVTAFAVGAHEIPREVGDFAVMIERGLKTKKIFMFNFAAALSALLGAVLMFAFSSTLQNFLPLLLAITAGFFIYISAGTLIPEIHEKNQGRLAFLETLFILLGVLTVWFILNLLEH